MSFTPPEFLLRTYLQRFTPASHHPFNYTRVIFLQLLFLTLQNFTSELNKEEARLI